MNYEMRLQEKYEAGWKVGFAKGKAMGTIRVVSKTIRAMKDAGNSNTKIFNLAREISDGEISDEKMRVMIANG